MGSVVRVVLDLLLNLVMIATVVVTVALVSSWWNG
jgi:hypothetical protein